MLQVRERKCREHYGEDVWAVAEPKQGDSSTLHPYVSLTVLPNRTTQTLQAYEQWIQTELGEAMRTAKMSTG
jgi:hypothetical protein